MDRPRAALLAVGALAPVALVTMLVVSSDGGSERGGADGSSATSSTDAPAASTTTRPAAATTTTAPPATAPVTSAPAPPVFTASVAAVTAADLPSSWRAGCPLGPGSLRAVTLSHWGFDGEVHTGTLVVHVDHAEDMVDVFRTLFDIQFPIERMVPVDAYGGDDDASMAANNTSAFNCRPVTGGTGWSEHAYGLAIDVNPVQNPYVIGDTVLPPSGATYLDREPAPGVIRAEDAVVQAFARIGWSWGGYWSSPVDYQHFSATGR
jgi:hypothetical protein